MIKEIRIRGKALLLLRADKRIEILIMFKSLPIKKGYYDMGCSGKWVIHALFVQEDDDVMIDLQSTNKPQSLF